MIDEYPGELYDMYQNSRNSRTKRAQPKYVEEGEEASDYDDGSFDENEFEMVSSRPPPRSRTASTSGRGQSRRPEMRKIRVKVHAEDVRYLMIGPAIEFADFVDRIREKFAIRKRFKITVRDDDLPNGDMITMGDQDDLDMAILTVKDNARRERLDMGKMEVSNPVGLCESRSFLLTPSPGLGKGTLNAMNDGISPLGSLLLST
jgi:hypothetical protein